MHIPKLVVVVKHYMNYQEFFHCELFSRPLHLHFPFHGLTDSPGESYADSGPWLETMGIAIVI